MSVAVLILTLNEEQDIEACIASAAWASEVVVLDSCSTDQTVMRAAQAGARVVLRPFDNYAAQRNFGLNEIPYAAEWILMLDADERVPADLAQEILAAVATADANLALFRMRRRDHLYGRWIRGSSGYPTWFGRLVRRGRVAVERPINEQFLTSGDVRHLDGHLDHYPFSKGFSAWLLRHDRYSTMEAQLLHAEVPGKVSIASLFATDADRRRRAAKALLYRLPVRPLLVFVALYFGKGGFLEGRAGLTFSLLRAWYEFLIDCKVRELARRAAGLGL